MNYSQKKVYQEKAIKKLKEKHKIENHFQVPEIIKIVINCGVGAAVDNPSLINESVEQMEAMTGQRVVLTRAKKSISNFKLREGQVIGCKVTLRKKNMYDFLTKLINLAIPKIRDFRGLPKNGFDGMGNYNLGLKEMSIFPEVKTDKVLGANISLITTAKNDEIAYDLLDAMAFPFRKN